MAPCCPTAEHLHPEWRRNHGKQHAIFVISCTSNNSKQFSAIIVEGFGFSVFDTLLVTSLAFVLQLVLILLATCGSSYLPNTRTYWMAWNYALSIAGVEMVRQLPVHMKWGRLFGACLAGSYTANFPLFLSLISGNVSGFTKKTTVTAIVSFLLRNKPEPN